MAAEIILYIIIFFFGIVIGSFANVLIYRLPLHENFISEQSHCMTCGHRLKWYDLFPLFSWLALHGRCRYCKAKLSAQYPLVEAINGCGYVLIFICNGFTVNSILYSLCFTILTVISVIDWRTYEIPAGLNIAVGVIGIIAISVNYTDYLNHLIGLVSISGFLLILYVITRGRGVGGGDIKLMAAAGLLLGWKNIILALILGCIAGSIIHPILMKKYKKSRVLAFGPYLSAGIVIAMLYGDRIIEWYIRIVSF